MSEEIIMLSVAELSDLLCKRELSSHEVTAAYLEQIEKTDGIINAYITKTDERAKEKALEADKRIERGDAHPLCGVPVALKDNIAVKGVRMTCASKMLEEFVPPYNATVTEKIERSGGVILGKTNLDEFAMGSSCERSIIGATHNPIDTRMSAGGSSGGSAAAVAARSAPWAIGTDTGGSARQPASFCGIVSMKPTYGLVSRWGVTELASSLDTVCPMTRNVYDNALMLNVLSGKDQRDMTSLDSDEDYCEGIGVGVGKLNVAIMRDYEKFCSPDAVNGVRRTARIFEELGASVDEVSLPSTDSTLEIYLVLTSAEASSNLARYDGLKYGSLVEGESYSDIVLNSRSNGFGDEVKRRVLTGTFALSSANREDSYDKIKRAQADIVRRVNEIYERYDVILMPTAAGTAFALGTFDADPFEVYSSDRFTTIANVTGCPAITIPVGGNGNLPVGVSLMGRVRSEKLLYRAAFSLEKELCDTVKKEVGRVE